VADFDALYREQAPAASLAKSFGARRLDLIEAPVQEAFVSAIERWGKNVPERPGAWLLVAARRRVLDAIRRATWIVPSESLDDLEAPAAETDHDEDLLKMMFACCHPAIPLESALALALRTLCGFPVPALSRALRLDEAAVEKSLIRARQVLREEHVELELEGAPESQLGARVDGVLRTLYVLFLESYSAHAGDTQIDLDFVPHRDPPQWDVVGEQVRYASWPRAACVVLAPGRPALFSSRRCWQPDTTRSAGTRALGPRDDR
jgi:predicted RNA polymerase sigma factor